MAVTRSGGKGPEEIEKMKLEAQELHASDQNKLQFERDLEIRRAAIGDIGREVDTKLATFITSGLLIFCGYTLINFERFSEIHTAPLLFLMAGVGVILGFAYRIFTGLFLAYTALDTTKLDTKKAVRTMKLHRFFGFLCILFQRTQWVIASLFFLLFLYAGYTHLEAQLV